MKGATGLVSAALVAAGFGQLAWAGTGEPGSSVPSQLAVPGGREATVKFNASGVQIYRCGLEPKVVSDYGSTFESPDRYVWTLVAPEATLLDENGKVAGHHYAGPTWEVSDGSKLVGKVLAKATAPDGASIPWLLLSTTVVQSGDRLGRVAFVQRLHTNGGVAPTSGCSREAASTEVRVPYTADYYFY